MHGPRFFVLESAGGSRPSTFELRIRSKVHARDGRELDTPYHERLLSAPNIQRRLTRDFEVAQAKGQLGPSAAADEYQREADA